MSRGLCVVGLYRPKNVLNVGEVLRACGCYGASALCVDGPRYKRAPTDTQGAYRRIPMIECGDLRGVVPFGSTCVAVDLVDGATPLPAFTHPERAFYVFGPEDGTLGDSVLAWCPLRVMVPTSYCMNLAATVNVVLYDRMAKQAAK